MGGCGRSGGRRRKGVGRGGVAWFVGGGREEGEEGGEEGEEEGGEEGGGRRDELAGEWEGGREVYEEGGRRGGRGGGRGSRAKKPAGEKHSRDEHKTRTTLNILTYW